MRDADAVLTIMPKGSGESRGTEIGVQEGIFLQKPMFTVRGEEDVPRIIAWLRTLPDNLDLSIGCPRASECHDAYEQIWRILDPIVMEDISGSLDIINKDFLKVP